MGGATGDFDAGVIRLQASQTKTRKPRTLPIYGDMPRWLEGLRAKAPADFRLGLLWRAQPPRG